jgi:hypothetical protein
MRGTPFIYCMFFDEHRVNRQASPRPLAPDSRTAKPERNARTDRSPGSGLPRVATRNRTILDTCRRLVSQRASITVERVVTAFKLSISNVARCPDAADQVLRGEKHP